MDDTRPELLEALREDEADLSWDDFFQQYKGVIVRFVMKMGVREEEAPDLLQEVMIELMQAMKKFEYDPEIGTFRSFLFKVTRRKVYRHWRRKKSRGGFVTGNVDSLEHLEDERATGSALLWADSEASAWRMSIVEDCLAELSSNQRYGAETIQLFIEYVIEERSVSDICERYGKDPNTVYQIKNRIITILRKRLANRLDHLDQQGGASV